MKYKNDTDIENEFSNMEIKNITINKSGISGFIEIDFPCFGEHVGGGCENVVDNWIKYDDGKIAFNNWYPEKVYFKLVDAINLKLN